MIAWSTTPLPSLAGLAARVWSRLSGREAAALRYQRDAHAEEAGREQQRRIAAERAADRMEKELLDAVARGDAARREREIIRGRHDIAVGCLYTLAKAHERGPAAVESALADAWEWLRNQSSPAFVSLDEHRRVVESARFLGETQEITIGHLRAVLADATGEAADAARTWLYRLAHHADDLRRGAPVEDLPTGPAGAELEGSRAGLAWMPGEATADDETLESEGARQTQGRPLEKNA